MTIQFSAKKQQTVSLEAKETEIGLERLSGEAPRAVRKDLDDTAARLAEEREVIEGELGKLSDAKETLKTATRQVRFGLDAIVAIAKAFGETSLLEVNEQRDRGNELPCAELMQERVSELKAPVFVALAVFLSVALDKFRAATAAIVKANDAVSKADVSWSSDYFRLVSVINLGISMQQAAGFELQFKRGPRRPVSKVPRDDGGTSPPVTPVVMPDDVP